MLRLPGLSVGSVTWHLPVTDWAAAQLVGLILADQSERRADEVQAVLADEPGLALWSACRAGQGGEAPGSIRELAEWFAIHGLHLLVWPVAPAAASPLADQSPHTRWADWAAESVAAARIAARLANAETAERRYLTELLHRAPEWLGSCCSQDAEGKAASSLACLPAGLTGLLDEPIQAAAILPDIATTAGDVAAAQLGTDQHDLVPTPGAEADYQHAHCVRQRWLATTAEQGAEAWLPALTRKLAQLATLQADFETAVETAKLQALKALAYGASHEINNPLANISMRAQTLLRAETNPERRRQLAVINSQAFRAHEMIADLMLFAQPPELQWADVELTALIDQVLAELAVDAAEQGAELVRSTPDQAVHCRADGIQLAVVLKSLCRNSLEVISQGGRIEVSALELPAADPHDRCAAWIELRVCDTGPGISEQVRKHLFDPYFSGREAGRGLGLGLSKCWRIVSDHGGHIEVASRPEGGAVFCVKLPKGITADRSGT